VYISEEQLSPRVIKFIKLLELQTPTEREVFVNPPDDLSNKRAQGSILR
jgi:hypothetical protein